MHTTSSNTTIIERKKKVGLNLVHCDIGKKELGFVVNSVSHFTLPHILKFLIKASQP